MNRQDEKAVIELEDFVRELNQDAAPKFQFDYSGRIWKRGHRHEWAIHEEGEGCSK